MARAVLIVVASVDMRLILYRVLAATAIALVSMVWVYPAALAAQQDLMLMVGAAFVCMLLVQSALRVSRISEFSQWLLQYVSDIVLGSVLIFASGGIVSPFSLLLGLIIIAAGMHARRLLPLVLSILTCIAYLAAVYGEAWLLRAAALDTQQALHVLLQTSTFMLVGGVMAFIARRHASLRAKSDKAVRQHRKLKDLHDNIMAEMCEGVIVLDQALQVSDMNDAARALLQRQPVSDLLAIPAVDDFFRQQLLTSFQCEYVCESKHEGRHNGACHTEDDVQMLLLSIRRLSADDDAAWLLTIVDISDIRRLEQQLIQQEKMAELGKMAAMLAHEIRNPIQTMAQSLEIMVKAPANSMDLQDIMRDEMLRLNRLVSMMLEYSKPLHPAPVPTYMPELIKASLHQLSPTGHRGGGNRAQLNWQCQADELCLDGDHFRLVLDNLLSNALNNTLSEGSIEIVLFADHRHWMLSVSNTGEISASLRAKLFEPFVSGRASGVGLGLAMVQQVCMLNGWSIGMVDEDGRICFKVSGPIQLGALLSAG